MSTSRSRGAAVVAVFDQHDRVLLLRRGPTAPWRPGWLNCPGGHIEPGERPADAACRETLEEAGLIISPMFLFRRSGLFAYGARVLIGRSVETTEQPFSETLDNRSVKCKLQSVMSLDGEHDAYMWVKLSELPEHCVPSCFEIREWLLQDLQRRKLASS